MVDLVKAAATAKRLIEANGRSVQLFKVDRTPADTSEPWRGVSGAPSTAAGGASQAAIVAFVPATGGGFGKVTSDRPGTLATAVTTVGLLAANSVPSSVDVSQFDSIRDGAKIWKIVAREELRPATGSIMWQLGLTG